jgi:putative salt-induced outer membrane protein YdiY
MKIVQIITLSILVVGSVLTASAQILNIEQERIKTDTTGWAGSAKLSFHYSKTDQELLSGGAYMHIQYKTKRSYYLNLTEYNLTKSSGSEYVNAGIQHFRYNYKFNDWFLGETFTQAQFNKILKVKFRWLFAAGPRIKIVETKPFSLYIAALYMYEYEELYDTSVICRYHRLSSYMSSILKLRDNLNLINTNYFQPRIDKFPDYRIFSQTDLKIGINKHFSFLASYIYSYDAFPPFGVPKETHYIGNSLAFDF